jgi:YVTN family beta-propeller protein
MPVLLAALALASVHVGAQPIGIAYGAGALWTANYGSASVSRIDPTAQRLVATIHLGVAPVAIASTRGAVWVGDAEQNSVFRIDPSTNTVVATIPIDTNVGALYPARDGSVWVSEFNAGVVVRIDPATNRVTARVRVGGEAAAIAESRGSLWVANAAGYISQIDQSTLKVVGAAVVVDGGLDGLVSTPVGLFAITYTRGALLRIDPRKHRIVGRTALKGHPAAVMFTGTALWVSDVAHSRVTVVDPRTAKVMERRSTGDTPRQAVRVGSWIWIANQGSNSVTRIPLR